MSIYNKQDSNARDHENLKIEYCLLIY